MSSMAAAEPVANRWLITVTVMTATIMAALDISIVNVALPYMRGNLSATVEEITWVATGYLLSNVIVMPMIAMLTVRFGAASSASPSTAASSSSLSSSKRSSAIRPWSRAWP